MDNYHFFIADKMVAEKANRRRSSDVVNVQMFTEITRIIIFLSFQIKHDPWGKAGPGGVLWRNPRTIGNGKTFMRSMVIKFRKYYPEFEKYTTSLGMDRYKRTTRSRSRTNR